jgi:hypothetical protein
MRGMANPLEQADEILRRKRDVAQEAQRRLDEAQRRLDIAIAELRSWEEAYTILTTPMKGVVAAFSTTEAPQSDSADKRRGPKGAWKRILAGIAQAFPPPTEFDLSEVEQISASVGERLERSTIRSQMANYANVGVVERVALGRFRLTAVGLSTAGVLPVASGRNTPDTEKPAEGGTHTAGSSVEGLGDYIT